jgi:acyl-coenzyme A synthetase/AMP-(fatty) acid ligase
MGEGIFEGSSRARSREPRASDRQIAGRLPRRRLGAAVAPKEIAFLDELPRTRSGKILRRLLKARELGLPEGDLSTLETGTG